MDNKFYSPQEVAEMFGVKTLTVYRWIKSGKLRASKVGQWHISKEDVDNMLDPAHGQDPDPDPDD